MIGEKGVEELAEAVGDGEAAADDAEVVLGESGLGYQVGRGGGERLPTEVVAAPAEEQGDVQRPPPAEETVHLPRRHCPCARAHARLRVFSARDLAHTPGQERASETTHPQK